MNLMDLAIVITAKDAATQTIGKIEGAFSGLGAAGSKLTQMGTALSVQGQLMKGTADGIRNSLMGIQSPADDLEESLAKVSTVITPMKDLETSIGNVKQAAIDWSTSHRDSAGKFVDTTYNMISAGLDEAAALEGTRTAMMVARATMGDAAQAGSLVATVYNNMGDKTADLKTEMGSLGDTITKTQQTFQFENLNQLNEGLKYGVPIALQNKMAFSELSTVIGQLNNAGITGSQAGTSFAATMRMMGKASGDLGFEIERNAEGGVDFINTLKNIEGQYGSLGEMSEETKQRFADSFGSEGWMGLSLMVGKSGELEQNLAKVQDKANAAADATAQMEGTRTGGWEIFANQVTALKISLGDELGPVLTEITPMMKQGVSAISGFVKQNPGLTRAALVLTMVTGAILAVGSTAMIYVGSMMMFGGHALMAARGIGTAFLWMGKVAIPAVLGMMKATAAWSVALLANPITWIVLGIAAAAFLIYRYWEPITGFFSGIWSSIKGAFDQGWTNGIVKLIELFSPVVWIAKGMNAVTEWLFGFSLFDAGANIVKSVWNGIQSMADAPVAAMRRIVGRIRNLLPFSPAKDGPLRDIHKIRLVETIADSLHPEPLTHAMRGVVAAAALTVPATAGAMSYGLPQTVPLASIPANQNGGARSYELHQHLHVGNASPEMLSDLEALLEKHGRKLLEVIKEEERKERRGDFA